MKGEINMSKKYPPRDRDFYSPEKHDLQINALEGNLPEGIDRSTIFKTLALKGDKTGPVIGIIPITEHLSEKKLAKL